MRNKLNTLYSVYKYTVKLCTACTLYIVPWNDIVQWNDNVPAGTLISSRAVYLFLQVGNSQYVLQYTCIIY